MTDPRLSASSMTCPACRSPLPPPAAESGHPTARWPHFPFCSDRCRLLDLGKWLEGAYVIPGDPTGPTDPDR